MMEKIVHTAKQTVKASVLMPNAVVRSPFSTCCDPACVTIGWLSPCGGDTIVAIARALVDVDQAEASGSGLFAELLSNVKISLRFW
jgi:hypothetical protein